MNDRILHPQTPFVEKTLAFEPHFSPIESDRTGPPSEPAPAARDPVPALSAHALQHPHRTPFLSANGATPYQPGASHQVGATSRHNTRPAVTLGITVIPWSTRNPFASLPMVSLRLQENHGEIKTNAEA